LVSLSGFDSVHGLKANNVKQEMIKQNILMYRNQL